MNSVFLWAVLALLGVVVLICLAYYWGYQIAKQKQFAKIGMIDEFVQDATNKSLLQLGRTDQINVAGIERYLAIVVQDKAIFIDLDKLC